MTSAGAGHRQGGEEASSHRERRLALAARAQRAACRLWCVVWGAQESVQRACVRVGPVLGARAARHVLREACTAHARRGGADGWGVGGEHTSPPYSVSQVPFLIGTFVKTPSPPFLQMLTLRYSAHFWPDRRCTRKPRCAPLLRGTWTSREARATGEERGAWTRGRVCHGPCGASRGPVCSGQHARRGWEGGRRSRDGRFAELEARESGVLVLADPAAALLALERVLLARRRLEEPVDPTA